MLCSKNKHVPYFIICCLFLLAPMALSAHSVAELNKFSRTDVAQIYFKEGFTHIIPLGFDHILFVLSLFFLNPQLKVVIWQATAFTLAHSITLGLAMFGFISPPSHIIEPIIALSIMFVALENMISEKLRPSRILLIFGFGLIHGMGFAGALTELGLPQNKFLFSLITFNLGVELGQITIIILAWFVIGKWFHLKTWYRKGVVIPISAVIAVIALYWTIERTFFT